MFAQGSLPQTILQASAELTAQEKATVDKFVETQATRLLSTDPAEVAAGRANHAMKNKCERKVDRPNERPKMKPI